ncbi:C-X-C chemokine receptor type 3-like [Heptranchias perlo]|uniref:C-X-C chemokine receptor type 3-like n=1 Tax=Heptranchias perlo TaxID=212740 RepID=UPI00355AA928
MADMVNSEDSFYMDFYNDNRSLFDLLNLNYSFDYFPNDSSDPCDTSVLCPVEPCDAMQSKSFNQIFFPVLYSAIFVVGLLGNGMVVLVLMRNMRMLAVTETYILHLAIADVLMVLSMPFWAVEEARGWIFGTVACKFIGAIFNINFYSSIYLLFCISIDRYVSIVHAVQMYKRQRSHTAYVVCLVVWCICLLFAIPDFIYLKPKYYNGSFQCVHNYRAESSKAWIMASRFFYHVTGFLIPLVVMSYCYLNIIRTLNRSQNLQRKKESKAIKVIVVVVAAFFICWTPYNIVMFLDTLNRLGALQRDCDMETQLDVTHSITGCLGYLHCCLNPFLYAFVGMKFRRHLLKMLRDGGCVSQEFARKCAGPSRRQSIMSVSESGDTSYSGF